MIASVLLGAAAGPAGAVSPPAGVTCTTSLPAAGGVTSNPLSCTVNCAGGGKLASAVALKPFTTSGLTITVKGTCVESVDHVPGGITIQGASSTAGLQAPKSTTDPVLGIGGSGVTLSNLTISGGVNALRLRSGAAVTGNDLMVEGASNANVLVNHGSLTLNTSTIEKSANNGINVAWGGVVFLNGGIVQQNKMAGINADDDGSADVFGGAILENNGLVGAAAAHGGAVAITAGTVTKNGFGAGGQGGVNVGTGGHVVVTGVGAKVLANSVRGIGVFDGGSLIVQDRATVASNAGDGIHLSQGGFVKVKTGAMVLSNTGKGIDVQSGNVTVGDSFGPAFVENNKGDGLFMRTNSVANFGNAGTKITGNGGWGIFCAGPPANPLRYGAPIGTVTGNTAGQIHCNTSP
jgi:hypothetical protein